MLMKTQLDTDRDVTRQLVTGETMTTVPVARTAANASHWTDNTSQSRRLRRQRRMARALRRMFGVWSVRTL